jgi:hypothetical protein
MQTYDTEIVIWSNIGHTPLTNRTGAYCDELVRVTVPCTNPGQALELTQKLIKETPHGYSGYFNMIEYPNQNTRNRFTH